MPGDSASEAGPPMSPTPGSALPQLGRLAVGVSAGPYLTALQARTSSQGQPGEGTNHAQVLIWHHNSQDHLS